MFKNKFRRRCKFSLWFKNYRRSLLDFGMSYRDIVDLEFYLWG